MEEADLILNVASFKVGGTVETGLGLLNSYLTNDTIDSSKHTNQKNIATLH